MSSGLKILSAGLHTTVQDLGRTGWQRLGVPVSGALDGIALRLGNALVGNPPGMAGLEFLYSGAELEIVADAVRIALTGSGATLLSRAENGRAVVGWQSVRLERGEQVRIVLGSDAVCAYLAVEGGIAVPPVLGSASTYVRAALGGLDGRALRSGDVVPLAIARALPRAELRLPTPPAGAAGAPVRVVLGPQRDWFTDDAVATLLAAEFRVSKNADRMGMRLDGPLLRHRRGWDIVSDAIATGAIQVPGSGQPILLLADHQTTGGYPKIATVISADLPVVGRRRPGDTIRFAAVTIEDAERLAREQQRWLTGLIAALEPAPAAGGLDLASLYAENLVSGVVSGSE
ncbi:MAG: biotin-dependent carboxyltransferase family protein [Stellaceae bacterium]